MQKSIKQSQHPTTVKIHLSRFKENVKALKRATEGSELLAVVKSNAYGHGMIPIAHAAVEAGANRLGVTTVEEGVLLRKNGISIPIHLLSAVLPEQAEDVVTYELTASISDFYFAKSLNTVAMQMGKKVSVHLKVDTGLHRFGIAAEEVIDFLHGCYHFPNLYWEGIYTHFSRADEADWQTTEQQFTLFKSIISKLANENFHFPIHHCGGSTIAIERKDMHLDMVRPGISLFGYHPNERQEKLISLQPVMEIKSKIVQITPLSAYTKIGYGGEFITKSPSKIAVIPIGHGNGYQRILSNKGTMLVSGKRANVVGTIALDQTLIDISHLPHVKVGDEVVVLGKQANEEITARELANKMHTIVDEVLTGFTRTYPALFNG